MTGFPFDGLNVGDGDVFDKLKQSQPQTESKPLPAIRGKQFDGVLYVRARDVADALESQAADANRRLIDKLRSAAAQADQS